jgi:hypothetical protein
VYWDRYRGRASLKMKDPPRHPQASAAFLVLVVCTNWTLVSAGQWPAPFTDADDPPALYGEGKGPGSDICSLPRCADEPVGTCTFTDGSVYADEKVFPPNTISKQGCHNLDLRRGGVGLRRRRKHDGAAWSISPCLNRRSRIYCKSVNFGWVSDKDIVGYCNDASGSIANDPALCTGTFDHDEDPLTPEIDRVFTGFAAPYSNMRERVLEAVTGQPGSADAGIIMDLDTPLPGRTDEWPPAAPTMEPPASFVACSPGDGSAPTSIFCRCGTNACDVGRSCLAAQSKCLADPI